MQPGFQIVRPVLENPPPGAIWQLSDLADSGAESSAPLAECVPSNVPHRRCGKIRSGFGPTPHRRCHVGASSCARRKHLVWHFKKAPKSSGVILMPPIYPHFTCAPFDSCEFVSLADQAGTFLWPSMCPICAVCHQGRSFQLDVGSWLYHAYRINCPERPSCLSIGALWRVAAAASQAISCLFERAIHGASARSFRCSS